MHLNDSFSHLHKLIYCILWRLYTNFALILKQPRIKCRTQLYFYLYAEKLTIGWIVSILSPNLSIMAFMCLFLHFSITSEDSPQNILKVCAIKSFSTKSFGHGLEGWSVRDIFANLSILKTVISLCFSQYPTR